MKTVIEVSRLTGVSVRALHHYDKIGLLSPTALTAAGYRLYDEAALARLQQILLFRELGFSLRDIRQILGAPDFDRNKALRQQIELLTLQKERLEGLIALARRTMTKGDAHMDFTAFDTAKIDAYTAQAKKQWGDTAAWKEFEEKTAGQDAAQQQSVTEGLMALFADFGQCKTLPPESETAQRQVKALQDYITAHYYTCTKEILSGLGQMYAAGGAFTENIDRAGGAGCAAFAAAAIAHYCGK